MTDSLRPQYYKYGFISGLLDRCRLNIIVNFFLLIVHLIFFDTTPPPKFFFQESLRYHLGIDSIGGY